MTIAFNCAACGTGYNVSVNCAGKRSRCTKCGKTLVVPIPHSPQSQMEFADPFSSEPGQDSTAEGPGGMAANIQWTESIHPSQSPEPIPLVDKDTKLRHPLFRLLLVAISITVFFLLGLTSVVVLLLFMSGNSANHIVMAGKYINEKNFEEYIHLSSDGTCCLCDPQSIFGNVDLVGHYEIDGNQINLTIKKVGTTIRARGKVIGMTIVMDDGKRYTKGLARGPANKDKLSGQQKPRRSPQDEVLLPVFKLPPSGMKPSGPPPAEFGGPLPGKGIFPPKLKKTPSKTKAKKTPVDFAPEKPLPADIRAAWEEAGFESLWINRDMLVHTYDLPPFAGKTQFFVKRRPGKIPGFRCRRWQDGVILKLPAPASTFALDLHRSGLTDTGLKELAALKQLESLHLGVNPGVTDKNLSALSGLKQLRVLDLCMTRVTDMGLKQLAGLKLRCFRFPPEAQTDLGLKHSLAALESSPTTFDFSAYDSMGGKRNRWRVTNAALDDLARLKQLKSLNVLGTNLTDGGLKKLAGLTELETLDLGHTRITDAGMACLVGLKKLKKLSLRHTNVTDKGVKELGALTKLETLDLCETGVGNAGLTSLGSLRQLHNLNLYGTRVTDAGLERLVVLKQLRNLRVGGLNFRPGDGTRKLRRALPSLQIN